MSPARRRSTGRRGAESRAAKRAVSGRAARASTGTGRAAPRTPPGLKVVRRSAPSRARRSATRPAPAFPQRADAAPKQIALFELVRSWTSVLAAVQGVSAATAEQPVGPGKWTLRETALHLHAWDLECQRALEPAGRGRRPAWAARGPGERARLNARLLAPLRHLPWNEALRRLQAGRARLLDAIEGLPEEPAASWVAGHPLGDILSLLTEHDHHHAEIIKQARAAASRPTRTP